MSYLRLVGRSQDKSNATPEQVYLHRLDYLKRIENSLAMATTQEERQIALAQHRRARVALKKAVDRLGESK